MRVMDAGVEEDAEDDGDGDDDALPWMLLYPSFFSLIPLFIAFVVVVVVVEARFPALER